jgi:hypothetical protein
MTLMETPSSMPLSLTRGWSMMLATGMVHMNMPFIAFESEEVKIPNHQHDSWGQFSHRTL